MVWTSTDLNRPRTPSWQRSARMETRIAWPHHR